MIIKKFQEMDDDCSNLKIHTMERKIINSGIYLKISRKVRSGHDSRHSRKEYREDREEILLDTVFIGTI